MVHIPYKGGGPAMIDLLGGNIQLIFATAASAVGHIKSGKIRALAVTTLKRSPLVPDLPTVAETGLKGFEANNWYGVMVPANTSRAIIMRLNKDISTALLTPDIKEVLFKQGLDSAPESPEAFGAYIKSELAKWAKVVKASGLKAE
jgi:tripartite-type tricarboxylate transporter receptor subunit TctC